MTETNHYCTHRLRRTPHPQGGPAKPPSVLTPLVPLHYSTCGEGKGALPGLFYATAAMMQGHAQLHMNPGIHSHAAESRRGARFGTIGEGQCPCGCAWHVSGVQARFWGYPSLPTRPQLEQQFIRDGRVHRGRERAPLCRPLNSSRTKIRCKYYTMTGQGHCFDGAGQFGTSSAAEQPEKAGSIRSGR